MKGAPRSDQFDDIYFSAENGWEETDHVFIKSNDLPEVWADKRQFTIAEAGFGTGLNFFSAWKLFEETAKPDQTFDFISFEKYPLSPEEIREALSPWHEIIGERLNFFLNQYPIRVAGFHRIKISKQVTLTLIFDDINDALPRLDAEIDCWFLDGFTPAKNPEMWSDTLFKNMARLSKESASFSSFTAAGDVRRRLQDVGFLVKKIKGFGHKRDMIVGTYQGEIKHKKSKSKQIKNIAIIGAGLAGTSCAYVLKQYGLNPVIYEASGTIANGASGNNLGLYNPRFSKLRDDLSDFFAPAYAQFISTAKQAGEAINYTPCGALHLMNEGGKKERYESMAKHWLWHEDHIKILGSQEAKDIAGIDLNCKALFLPDSGSVSPKKLCEFYAKDIQVHLNSKIMDLSKIEADAIIITTGSAIKNFDELKWVPMDKVRGQVTEISETSITKNLKCNIHYGGYLSKSYDNKHMIGATFEKWVDHTKVTDGNHLDNIQTLKSNIDCLTEEVFEVLGGRAGFRAATNDRFPLVGALPHNGNLYVSAAFGSHGLVGSILAAHYLADCLREGPYCLPSNTAKSLSPKRFIDRAAKKNRPIAL